MVQQSTNIDHCWVRRRFPWANRFHEHYEVNSLMHGTKVATSEENVKGFVVQYDVSYGYEY